MELWIALTIVIGAMVLAQQLMIIQLWTDVKGMKGSTHRIQYMNLPDEDFSKITEEMKTKLTEEPFDNIQ